MAVWLTSLAWFAVDYTRSQPILPPAQRRGGARENFHFFFSFSHVDRHKRGTRAILFFSAVLFLMTEMIEKEYINTKKKIPFGRRGLIAAWLLVYGLIVFTLCHLSNRLLCQLMVDIRLQLFL